MPVPDIASLVNRQVIYHYCRESFTFDLSHALFSSAGIDVGSTLLLGLLAREDRTDYARVVDVGCGTGVLGICLSRVQRAPLVAIDRDALAIAFTAHNARLNGIDQIDARASIVVPNVTDTSRELVVSNIPAKVGEPVLGMLIDQMLSRAARGAGRAAIVIVSPLAAFLHDCLTKHGAAIVAEQRTGNHLAVIAEPGSVSAGASAACEGRGSELPPEFIRTHATFQGPNDRYELNTVYNLPEFDGLAYRTALSFDLLAANNLGGRVLVYGCGQGHLVQGVAQRLASGGTIAIADRDHLGLATTQSNAMMSGIRISAVHGIPTYGALASSIDEAVDWLVLNDDPTPGSAWTSDALTLTRDVLSENGLLLLVSGSTAASRFEREARGEFAARAERRMRGYRAALLRRRR